MEQTKKKTLREYYLHLEFFWSVFSRIRTESYLSIFSTNARKHGPEKLRIRTLFT